MAKKRSALERMKSNPKSDWKIADVEKVCVQYGLKIRPPKNGSHYVVSSQYIDGHLTVPARRPIKPVYIKGLVSLIEAHKQQEEQNDEQ